MPTYDQVGAMTTEGGLEALAEILAGKIGTASHIHLYKASFTPGKSSVEADFVAAEADFAGYVAQTLTFAAPGVDAAGDAVMYSDDHLFVATNSVTPNTIGGAWVESLLSSGPNVNRSVEYYQFPTPINMSTPLAQFSIQLALQMPNLAGYAIIDV